MNPDDIPLPPLPGPELPPIPLDALDMYDALTPLAIDWPAEVDRLKREQLELVRQHTAVVQKVRDEAEALNVSLSDRSTRLRRAMAQIVVLVNTLRALHNASTAVDLVKLPAYPAERLEVARKQAGELLELCAGIE